MSTAKVVTILHPSSAVNNIVNDASGNVAVGNNLTVAGTTTLTGNVTASGSVTTAGSVALSSSAYVYSYAGGTNGQIRSGIYADGTNTLMSFYTAQAERMRLDLNGNFMVGTTSANGRLTANSTGTIAVYANSTGNHALFGDTGATGAYGVYGQTSNAAYGGTIGYHNGSGVFGILGYAGYGLYTNSSITVNGTVYSSDARLKENVSPIENALEKIAALNPVSFDWKAASSRGASSDFGLIAQEVEQIIPECVFETKTPARTLEMTHPLSLEEELGSYKGVDYSRFIPFLIAACKELSAKNDALEARLAALEAK